MSSLFLALGPPTAAIPVKKARVHVDRYWRTVAAGLPTRCALLEPKPATRCAAAAVDERCARHPGWASAWTPPAEASPAARNL
jgi:hypothetical protein